MVFGGEAICASIACGIDDSGCDAVRKERGSSAADLCKVVLSNILSDDDLEDEECLEECKEDILSIVSKYGEVSSIEICQGGLHAGNVFVTYVAPARAASAVPNLDGIELGGNKIRAKLWSANTAAPETECLVNGGVEPALLTSTNAGVDITNRHPIDQPSNCKNLNSAHTSSTEVAIDPATSKPMFTSSGKQIPERWAECKRAPKIPTCTGKPNYVQLLKDETAAPLLIEMLGSLMKFQIRSKDDANARSRRRLVIGFREVARGVRANKVKMVIMANNLDEYEAVSEKTQEVLDLCRTKEIPILFELNKRKLGKALGKTLKMSIVGVQNADGTHEQFKKLKVTVERERKALREQEEVL